MTKRAIVLAGGGSRGAYQIGCWRAFIELGLDFQIITGTSVGALNGAMMVQKNYQLALDIWKEISVNDVLDIEIPDIDISQKAGKKVLFSLLAKEAWVNGGAGMKALDQTIQKAIHEEEFFSSPIDFALMTVKLPLFKPIAIFKKDISSAEMLKNYLLASAACFPAFQAQKVGSELFIDGGYYDNMPINLALEMGAEEIIAIDLKGFGLNRKVKKNNKKITYIRPYHRLGDFVAFDKNSAQRLMVLGYQDAMKALGDFEGIGFTFKQGENKKNQQKLEDKFNQGLKILLGRNKDKDQPLAQLAFKKLLKMLAIQSLGNTKEDFLYLCSQYAGEIFNLEEAALYRYSDFNQLLLDEAKNRVEKWQGPQKNDLTNKPLILDEVLAKVKQLDRPIAVIYLLHLIKSVSQGQSYLGELQAAAIAFGKETAAALYLYALDFDYTK